MRALLLGTAGIALASVMAGGAYAQDCSGYPAAKTWDASNNPNNKLIQEADGAYLGWGTEGSDDATQILTQVEEVDCQTDTLEPPPTDRYKLKYRSDGPWTITGGQELSLSWKVYVSSTESSSPMVRIRQGRVDDVPDTDLGDIRLNFSANVGDNPGCTVSGWTVDSPSVITSGGRVIDRPGHAEGPLVYLPMPMNEWHTIRLDLRTGRTFDAWIDGADDGWSDYKHISGNAGEYTGSNRYVQFGQISSKHGKTEWSTACVAWGEGAETPAAPSGPEELCEDDLDNDEDLLVDGDDPDCDFPDPEVQCGQLMDIFERFNVNFSQDPVVPGRVPPHWSRTPYGHPAYSDQDPTIPPGASNWRLDPQESNQGPYYWLEPGPYEEEHDEMFDACMNYEIDWNEYPEFVNQYPGGACTPGWPDHETCCQNFADYMFHPSQPMRITLVLDRIPNQPDDPDVPGCGSMEPACMSGLITVEREVKADDLAHLPIDWSDPVTITVETLGIDNITLGGGGGNEQWATFVTYEGYTDPPASETRIEWGPDGDRPNAIHPSEYRPVWAVLDAGQADPAGPTTLIVGVDFDYIGSTLPSADTSTAFFENLAIVYTPDLTKPLIHLNKMAIRHEILLGDTLPNDSFTVTNAMPTTTMNYTIADDADWLSTSVTNGVATGGETDTVDIIYGGVSGLPEGVHTAVITVDSPEITKSPATITVTITVIGPYLELSESEFNHTVMAGTNPDDDLFTVTNAGGGSMTYSIDDGGAGWLDELPPAGGPLGHAQGDQIAVSYSTAILPLGDYQATITVTSPEADNSPQTIAVNVSVVLAPPDYDSDGDVDQDDFGIFQVCTVGEGGTPTEGLCATYADLDHDTDVDQQDYVLFEKCATGPEVLYEPGVTCVLPPEP